MAEEWVTTREAARRLGVSRKLLDRLAAEFPDLVGGPVNQAIGRRRRHLRWPAEKLRTWLDAALRAYHRPARPAVRPRSRGRKVGSDVDGAVDWRAERRR